MNTTHETMRTSPRKNFWHDTAHTAKQAVRTYFRPLVVALRWLMNPFRAANKQLSEGMMSFSAAFEQSIASVKALAGLRGDVREQVAEPNRTLLLFTEILLRELQLSHNTSAGREHYQTLSALRSKMVHAGYAPTQRDIGYLLRVADELRLPV